MKTALALLLDLALAAGFILISRVSHDNSLATAKVWEAMWPFLAGVGLGWLVTRAWRNPIAELSYLGVWGCAVAGGFLYRYLMRPIPKLADVVVAILVLGFVFGGWRFLAFLVASLRDRRARGLPVD